MRFLNEGELRQRQELVAVARRGISPLRWFAIDAAFGALLIAASLKGWLTVAGLLGAVCVGFNLLMRAMQSKLLCGFEVSNFIVRPVSASLLFKKTEDAMTHSTNVLLPLSEIRWFGAQNIEIVEEAGKISTHWLVFELEPEAMKELEGALSRFYSERMNIRRPVQFLLRYDSGRCYLRWDGVRPALGEFLAPIFTRFPYLNGNTQCEEQIIDAKRFALQPEAERRLKVSRLTNLGLGQLVLPLLTAHGAMSWKEAAKYVDSVVGHQPKG